MTFEFENETDVQFDFDVYETTKTLIEKCIDYVKCPFECEVCLTLTDNEGIHEMNREYRNIDRPTDVLSFPLVDYEAPEQFDGIDDDDIDYVNPDTGELMLGDIVISVDKVKSQAEEYGHSEKREFGFLVVHSMLHLFGHDHMEEEERIVMENKQREILSEVGIER